MILSQRISPLFCLLFLCFLEKIDAVIHSASRSFAKNYKNSDPDFTIHEVSLTQKGYIQFLKYASKVPTLTDYTFCIWVRSNNLTHNQPLLSYSKNEEERLVRVWISPNGVDLFLEILNHPITAVPVNVIVNRWYHICQSWSSRHASWEVYINGNLQSSGFVPKLKGVPIKGGGDIVVGQEYTDFDKGLDDGIEGDVFGFNFVLASTTSSALKRPINLFKLANYPSRRRSGGGKRNKPQLGYGKLSNIHQPQHRQLQYNFQPETGKRLIIVNNNRDFLSVDGGGYPETGVHVAVPRASYFSGHPIHPNRYDVTSPEFHGNAFDKFVFLQTRDVPVYDKRRIMNDIGSHQESLGLLLVELSLDCAFGKGAPLSGKGVLINWIKSPVRVYGGAILKNIRPFCREIGT